MSEEIEKVETEEVSKWDEEGNRPQMSVAKILQTMYSDAARVSKAASGLDLKRLEKAADFLEVAEANGFNNKQIVQNLQDAIWIAKEKGDTRALARLNEMVMKIMLQPANDMQRFFVQLQQNNIKMQAKEDVGRNVEDAKVLIESLPDEDKKKILKEWLSEYT